MICSPGFAKQNHLAGLGLSGAQRAAKSDELLAQVLDGGATEVPFREDVVRQPDVVPDVRVLDRRRPADPLISHLRLDHRGIPLDRLYLERLVQHPEHT